MKIWELGAKNKRAIDWGVLSDELEFTAGFRESISQELQAFKQVIKEAWEDAQGQKEVKPEYVTKIANLERRLEAYFEDARVN